MAQLYFYYSAMNAGKSTTLLQSAHNYEAMSRKEFRLDEVSPVGKHARCAAGTTHPSAAPPAFTAGAADPVPRVTR